MRYQSHPAIHIHYRSYSSGGGWVDGRGAGNGEVQKSSKLTITAIRLGTPVQLDCPVTRRLEILHAEVANGVACILERENLACVDKVSTIIPFCDSIALLGKMQVESNIDVLIQREGGRRNCRLVVAVNGACHLCIGDDSSRSRHNCLTRRPGRAAAGCGTRRWRGRRIRCRGCCGSVGRRGGRIFTGRVDQRAGADTEQQEDAADDAEYEGEFAFWLLLRPLHLRTKLPRIYRLLHRWWWRYIGIRAAVGVWRIRRRAVSWRAVGRWRAVRRRGRA